MLTGASLFPTRYRLVFRLIRVKVHQIQSILRNANTLEYAKCWNFFLKSKLEVSSSLHNKRDSAANILENLNWSQAASEISLLFAFALKSNLLRISRGRNISYHPKATHPDRATEMIYYILCKHNFFSREPRVNNLAIWFCVRLLSHFSRLPKMRRRKNIFRGPICDNGGEKIYDSIPSDQIQQILFLLRRGLLPFSDQWSFL